MVHWQTGNSLTGNKSHARCKQNGHRRCCCRLVFSLLIPSLRLQSKTTVCSKVDTCANLMAYKRALLHWPVAASQQAKASGKRATERNGKGNRRDLAALSAPKFDWQPKRTTDLQGIHRFGPTSGANNGKSLLPGFQSNSPRQRPLQLRNELWAAHGAQCVHQFDATANQTRRISGRRPPVSKFRGTQFWRQLLRLALLPLLALVLVATSKWTPRVEEIYLSFLIKRCSPMTSRSSRSILPPSSSSSSPSWSMAIGLWMELHPLALLPDATSCSNLARARLERQVEHKYQYNLVTTTTTTPTIIIALVVVVVAALNMPANFLVWHNNVFSVS